MDRKNRISGAARLGRCLRGTPSKAIAVFLMLGVAAWIGLPYVPHGGELATSALAIVDVALMFAVFKGDIWMT